MGWIKSHKRKLMFFILFFIICGSSSIWMSFLFLEEIGCKDVAIGLITISIASVCASAERILEKIDKKSEARDDNDDFYGIAWLVVPLLASIIVIGMLKRSEITALIISILVYFLYCWLWWYQNRNRSIFNNQTSSLGGEIK